MFKFTLELTEEELEGLLDDVAAFGEAQKEGVKHGIYIEVPPAIVLAAKLLIASSGAVDTPVSDGRVVLMSGVWPGGPDVRRLAVSLASAFGGR